MTKIYTKLVSVVGGKYIEHVKHNDKYGKRLARILNI